MLYSLIGRNEEPCSHRYDRHHNLRELLKNDEKFMMQRKGGRAFQVEKVPKQRQSQQKLAFWGEGTHYIYKGSEHSKSPERHTPPRDNEEAS